MGPPSCPAHIVGGTVTGSSDAVYIAYGCYTGDGALNAIAFANGPRGWGYLTQPSTSPFRKPSIPLI